MNHGDALPAPPRFRAPQLVALAARGAPRGGQLRRRRGGSRRLRRLSGAAPRGKLRPARQCRRGSLAARNDPLPARRRPHHGHPAQIETAVRRRCADELPFARTRAWAASRRTPAARCTDASRGLGALAHRRAAGRRGAVRRVRAGPARRDAAAPPAPCRRELPAAERACGQRSPELLRPGRTALLAAEPPGRRQSGRPRRRARA